MERIVIKKDIVVFKQQNTSGGGLSWLKGSGTLFPRSVSGWSNINFTTVATSLAGKTNQGRLCIKTQREEKLRKMKSGIKAFPSWRIVALVSKPQTFEGQFLPVAEWVDSLNNKLFSVVTRLAPSPVEFDHPLHQHIRTTRFIQGLPLINNQRWKEGVCSATGAHRPNQHGTTFGRNLSSNLWILPSGTRPGGCNAASAPCKKTPCAHSEPESKNTRKDWY
jgi:hypothetical protein